MRSRSGALAEAGHHQGHAAPGQVFLDAASHRGEEWVRDIGNRKADRRVRAGAEAAGQQVRDVVQFNG